MPTRIRERKRERGRKRIDTVTVTIERGLIAHVDAPKSVKVVIKDYDIRDWDFADSELKTDEKGERYMEEIWEGEDA